MSRKKGSEVIPHLDSKLFLPYQLDWILDLAKIKIWEKSRRIGATYAQSYEDVYDMLNEHYPAVWFSSADETAAKEYIRYCKLWADMFAMARPDIQFMETKNALGMLQLQFSNGKRITALTSNPKGFRSKGGKVVLDEFAHHDRDTEMWKAAKPATTWGYPIRVLSTHNGQQCLFYRFIEEIRADKLCWSLHRTTIYDAVEQKLVDAMQGRKVSEEERNNWIADLRKNCFDDSVWKEEFCCIPVDEVTAFLSYELIRSCEEEVLTTDGKLTLGKEFYVGIDIGRFRDLTVIFVIESTDDIFITRQVHTLKGMKFEKQKEFIFTLLHRTGFRRCAIDGTGIGMNLAEDCVEEFGTHAVEVIGFTAKRKEQMAYLIRKHFENRTILIPPDGALRDDLHAVRKTITIAGNARFEANRSETDSHADRFWALALALTATDTVRQPSLPVSRHSKPRSKSLKGYL